MDNYFTPKEVSEKLKLNIRTIYKWIREGKINASKLGDVWRISESELNRILGENGENKK
jgi:excisionase family DNA binding protein